MNEISAKYFSTKFIIDNKLNLTDIVILEYIYSWILSNNPPECKPEMGKKCFYLSQTHIADDFKGLITQQSVSQKMKRLERCKIINSVMTDVRGRCFVRFNWDKVYESLAPRECIEQQKYKYCSNWYEKIFQYIYEEEQLEKQWGKEWEKKSLHERVEYYKQEEKQLHKEYEDYRKKINSNSYNNSKEENMSGLFDNVSKKVYYSKQADAIVKRIMKKYANYFVMKVPKENQEPTKTYIRTCRKIDDIFNGRFTSSRYYNFDRGVFENKQFDTEGWRETILAARNDWGKVKELIFGALKNFELMYDDDRMPMNKGYLTGSLNEWFYSDNPNCRGQSQFIQSLKEPMYTKQKLGLDKAKGIVEDLKKNSSVSYYSGHELNELLPENANEGTAWKYIQDIIKWGKLLWQSEKNSRYFMECDINGKLESGPKVLPALFARYLKMNKINVSLNTLNIEQGAENGGPWSWFIKDACDTHKMNFNFVHCFDVQDFLDASNDNRKLSFDNMEEIPVF